MNTIVQEDHLMDLEAVTELINQDRVLVLAGDDRLLEQLPPGNWIGGTNVYYYLKDENGRIDQDKIFVSDFTDLVTDFKIQTYDVDTLKDVCVDGFENGFTFLILPAFQDIHLSFSLNSPSYENQFINPLVGLICGAEFSEVVNGKLARIYNGFLGERYIGKGISLHCALPEHKVARLENVNVFEPLNNVTIEVKEDAFSISECLIDGQEVNLYDYLIETDHDIRQPVLADYAGAIINMSILKMDADKREVLFAAPLFKGHKYTFSKKLHSYVDSFAESIKTVFERESNIIYNCNCICNYLYGELDQNSIGFSGPTTYGEIGYQMLNQTFTYLAIDENETVEVIDEIETIEVVE